MTPALAPYGLDVTTVQLPATGLRVGDVVLFRDALDRPRLVRLEHAYTSAEGGDGGRVFRGAGFLLQCSGDTVLTVVR